MAGDSAAASGGEARGASAAPGSQCAVCSSAAEFRCSGCREVAYCCKEHQKMDWKNHKSACKPYEEYCSRWLRPLAAECMYLMAAGPWLAASSPWLVDAGSVQTSEVLGRHLVASRDLSPGEVLLSEAPLFWGPKAMADSEYLAPCVGCYRPVSLDVGERCASCGWPICSGHCPGLKDLRHHGLECVVLSLRSGCAVSNLGDYYRHDALLTLRCLLGQKKFVKRYKKLMELQSHMEERTPETEVYQETNEFIVNYLQDNFLHALRTVETQLNTNIAPEISDKLLHTICGIIDVNALDLRLNEGTEISALYAQTCLMEHSCFPNTKHSFDIINKDESSQFKITIKVILPIKKGEHITTMYSHALWGTQARREHLKETKYFDCVCVRCKDPTELGTYLSALRCIGKEKNQCGGIQLPKDPCDNATEWSCNKCEVKVKNEEVVYLISKMGEEVENVQANGPTVKQLEELITKLSTFLHQHHYHMYSVKHSLVQLYGYQQGYLHHQLSDEILNKKANMCMELIEITTKIDPGNSRLNLYSGVLYHELFQAKFQLLKNKLKNNEISKNNIDEIKEELQVYLKMAQMVLEDECEGSAGYKLTILMKESEKNLLRWIKDI